jgi:hypothetical protein
MIMRGKQRATTHRLGPTLVVPPNESTKNRGLHVLHGSASVIIYRPRVEVDVARMHVRLAFA